MLLTSAPADPALTDDVVANMICTKNSMFVALFFATLVPTILPVIFVPLTSFKPSWNQFLFLIGLLGNVHVGMTAFFYFGDRRYKQLIADNAWRFIWVPAALIACAFLMFNNKPAWLWLYIAAHYSWLLWHFGRQNFGLYSLVAAGNRSGAVSYLERSYLNLLPLAAIPKSLTLYSDIGLPAEIAGYFVSATWALACVGVAMLAAILVTRPNVVADKERLVALLLGLGFFAPTVVSNNPAIALTFFAHPVQYIIMMLYLAGDRKQGAILLRLCALIFTGMALWALLYYLNGASITSGYLAVAFGVSQAHFLIDAGAWKLKMPAQRAIITESYDFLFGSPDGGIGGGPVAASAPPK